MSETIEQLRFTSAPEESLQGITGYTLPVHPDALGRYHARYRSVHAVIATMPGEIRIPYVKRESKGDFKAFMDALVTRLNQNRVRFVNVFMSDSDASEAYDQLHEVLIDRPEDAVRLEDALHGFTHETECWDGDEVNTLVGEWTPDHAEAHHNE